MTETTLDRELQILRRCNRDLVAIASLPAIWRNLDSHQILRSLGEVLVKLLDLDFAYACVHHNADGQQQRFAALHLPGEAVHDERLAAVAELLAQLASPAPPVVPVVVANPLGQGTLRVAFATMGFLQQQQFLSAAAKRPDFPTEAERIVLTTAANQAAVMLGRTRAEEALRHQARLLEEHAQLLELSTDAVIVRDLAGHITSWSRGCEDIYGWSRQQALGQSTHTLLKTVFPRPLAALEQELMTHERWTGEVTHTRRDGCEVVVASRWALRRGDESTPPCILEINTDITERKKTEAERQNAKAAAEAANAAKSQFLANMSHEIRTPLGAILGFSEFLMDPRQSTEDRQACVATIRRNGEQLALLVDDILDLSKVEAGRLDVERIACSLADVIDSTLATLRFKAEEKGLTLEVLADGAVPAWIDTDPNRLRQILINVVGNAIKFTERGLVQVRIRTEAAGEGEGPRIAFVVKDSGVGLAPAAIARLFQPFSQADSSTTRRFGGTGLGLILSKRLALAMGGDLELSQSRLGCGSTFIVTIAAVGARGVLRLDASKKRGGAVAARSSAEGSLLQGTRILVVDDAPDNRLLISRYLRMAGATVAAVADGEEALTAATAGQYDAILMDIQMPRLDGYQATAKLRDQGCAVPIIALTACAMKEERERCLSSGFNDHLAKPINRRLMIEKIALHTR